MVAATPSGDIRVYVLPVRNRHKGRYFTYSIWNRCIQYISSEWFFLNLKQYLIQFDHTPLQFHWIRSKQRSRVACWWNLKSIQEQAKFRYPASQTVSRIAKINRSFSPEGWWFLAGKLGQSGSSYPDQFGCHWATPVIIVMGKTFLKTWGN